MCSIEEYKFNIVIEDITYWCNLFKIIDSKKWIGSFIMPFSEPIWYDIDDTKENIFEPISDTKDYKLHIKFDAGNMPKVYSIYNEVQLDFKLMSIQLHTAFAHTNLPKEYEKYCTSLAIVEQPKNYVTYIIYGIIICICIILISLVIWYLVKKYKNKNL